MIICRERSAEHRSYTIIRCEERLRDGRMNITFVPMFSCCKLIVVGLAGDGFACDLSLPRSVHLIHSDDKIEIYESYLDSLPLSLINDLDSNEHLCFCARLRRCDVWVFVMLVSVDPMRFSRDVRAAVIKFITKLVDRLKIRIPETFQRC